MAFDILTIPCLKDNYAFVLHDADSGATALVDAPEAAPVLEALNSRGWQLSDVFLTHHHWDHVDALPEILAAQPAGAAIRVVGAKADAHRLPALDLAVSEGERFEFAGQPVQIFDVSGHTVGHIAFYLPEAAALFTGDSLMALGCGRLFEGSPAQMWQSLQKLAALPGQSMVYSGHEYTASNAKFAVTVDPENPALAARVRDITERRAKGEATVPGLLQLELDTNPFLRAGDPQVQVAVGMAGADACAVFTEIRARKDAF